MNKRIRKKKFKQYLEALKLSGQTKELAIDLASFENPDIETIKSAIFDVLKARRR